MPGDGRWRCACWILGADDDTIPPTGIPSSICLPDRGVDDRQVSDDNNNNDDDNNDDDDDDNNDDDNNDDDDDDNNDNNDNNDNGAGVAA